MCEIWCHAMGFVDKNYYGQQSERWCAISGRLPTILPVAKLYILRGSYWQFTWLNAKRNIKHAFPYWGNRLLNKPVLPALADKHLTPLCTIVLCYNHDDVIKWKNFPCYWTFVWGIHRSPLNSPHKSQWRGALMFSLICARINGWVNNGEAEDFRRYRTHYEVTVIFQYNMMLHTALIQHNNVHVGNRQYIVITKNTQTKASAVLTKYVLHGLSVLMKTKVLRSLFHCHPCYRMIISAIFCTCRGGCGVNVYRKWASGLLQASKLPQQLQWISPHLVSELANSKYHT